MKVDWWETWEGDALRVQGVGCLKVYSQRVQRKLDKVREDSGRTYGLMRWIMITYPICDGLCCQGKCIPWRLSIPRFHAWCFRADPCLFLHEKKCLVGHALQPTLSTNGRNATIRNCHSID